MTKRYEQFPEMARLVRAMSPEGRELVAHWHRVLLTALEGYLPHAEKEAADIYKGPFQSGVRAGAMEGARCAVLAWLKVMRDVAAIVSDPSKGDWCCKRGMMAAPAPCPQHGFDVRVLYDAGTVIERPVGVQSRNDEGLERAVRVEGFHELMEAKAGEVWASIERGRFYVQPYMAEDGWTVVGRV